MRVITHENERWAKAIIQELFTQGVGYFCVSPGSRSCCLAYAIAEHPEIKSMVHFDERGMAFHALGYAKATKKAVALLVTSGTAAGNLFPAIMEASECRIPLVILTADRPPELRDCGANQTLDQVKLFGKYVRFEVDLPCPDPLLPVKYLSSTIAQGLYRAVHDNPGPVHLNCMFREPLLPPAPINEEITATGTIYEIPECLPSNQTLERWAREFSERERGVILCGTFHSNHSLEPLLELSQRLQWPILADITSPVRTVRNPCAIAYYDPLLKTADMPSPEIILHFGDRIVSKTLAEWVAKQPIEHYFLVADHPGRHDPKHQVTRRLQCDPISFCEKIVPYVSQSASSFLNLWNEQSALIEPALATIFAEEKACTEPGVIWSLKHLISEKTGLFFSNSMPIRDADFFFFPIKCGPIFANRGISGIDGNIATSIGLAQGLERPLVAVLGDLAFLHDMNSLAQIKQATYPVLFLIINNGGGGIFSFLPIAERKNHFEKFIAAAHDFSFESAATLFQLPYYRTEKIDEWETLLDEFIQNGTSRIVEMITDREQNHLLHQEITHTVKAQICSLAEV